MPDHLVHSSEQILGFIPILLRPFSFFGSRGEFADRGLAYRVGESMTAAEEKEILGAIFFVNFILIRQIVSNRGHVKIARLDQYLHRSHDRQLKLGLLIFSVPGRLLLEI